VSVQLLFAHGWALDASVWDAVLAELGGPGAIVLDAGYYGRPAPFDPASRIPGQPLLAIGHSLGVLQMLVRPPAPLGGLVAIDGFARFCADPTFRDGAPPRVVSRMRQRLGREPEAMLADFLQNAGGAAILGAPDTRRLDAGLAELMDLDGRAAVEGLPIWRLHASGDPIAPLASSDASLKDAHVIERRVREASDHLSPLHDPAACADLIRAAMEALS
jgi:pimeloyl-[acyl-carrier protein] methyl ester esterase